MDYCAVKQSNFKWKYNEASLFQLDNDKTYYSSTVCVSLCSGLVSYQTMKCQKKHVKWNLAFKICWSSLLHLSFAIISEMGLQMEWSTVHKIKSVIGGSRILCFTSLLRKRKPVSLYISVLIFNKYDTFEHNLHNLNYVNHLRIEYMSS